MNKIKRINDTIERLINIFQEQQCEIEHYKIQLYKLTHIFKLLSMGSFDIIKLSNDFDFCENENDIDILYNKYITNAVHTTELAIAVEPVLATEPCPNCKETIEQCACMRNICHTCGKPVGNITFTICDDCWDIEFQPKS